MRRLLSYSILSAAVLLGIGFSSVPMMEKLNTDVAYSDGRTLYFKASEIDPDSVTGNYGNADGDFLAETDKDNRGNPIIEDIAETMRTRLDGYSSTEYEVKTIGYDTVAVTLRSSHNDDEQYSNLARYLSFSGGTFELDASDTTYTDYPDDDNYSSILDYENAYIEYYTLGTGVELPTVVVPLTEGEEYQKSFRNLLNYCTTNTAAEETDDEGNITTAAHTTSIVIWANRKETDEYKNAESDPNVKSRVLTVINPSSAKWVSDSDAEKEESEQIWALRIVPESSGAFNSEGQYDDSKGAVAYQAAAFYLNMLKADKFEYEIAGSTTAEFAVTFTYSEKAAATVERLVTADGWNVHPALSKTLIATIITVVILAAFLLGFERLGGIAGVVATCLTGFIAFAIYFAFGAQFNIAALIGLAGAALLGLFGYLYYAGRLRNELYKGRTLRKANAEAAKKSTWAIVDSGVVAILLGVFTYLLGGDVLSKAGAMLAVGGLAAILVNLIVTRLLMWILCNDDTMQSSFPKLLNVNSKHIPNVLDEQKQTYYGPYAETNFKKFRKVGYVVSGVLLAAGVIMTSVFSALNGTAYNDVSFSNQETVLRLEVRSTEPNIISGTTASKLSSVSYLKGTDSDGNPRLLDAIKIEDKALSTYVTDITLSKDPYRLYTTPDAGSGLSSYWYFYEIYLSKSFDLTKTDYTITVWDGSFDGEGNAVFVEAASGELNPAIGALVEDRYVSEVNDFNIAFASINAEHSQPYLWQAVLALGVGFAVSALYFMIRFRPGKGMALALTSFAFSFVGIAFFAITRLPVNPTVSIGAVLSGLIVALLGILLLNAEKDNAKESKEKEKDTLAFKRENLEKTVSYEAGNIFVFAAIGLYVSLMYFAFGPLYFQFAYVNSLVGTLLGTAFLLFCFAGIAGLFMSLFGKIKFRAPKKKKKKVTGQLLKKKGSEAEESIFIGIND